MSIPPSTDRQRDLPSLLSRKHPRKKNCLHFRNLSVWLAYTPHQNLFQLQSSRSSRPTLPRSCIRYLPNRIPPATKSRRAAIFSDFGACLPKRLLFITTKKLMLCKQRINSEGFPCLLRILVSSPLMRSVNWVFRLVEGS